MSTNSIPLGSHRNISDTDRQSYLSNPSPEEKQSADYIINEAKRLIKSGHTKKAFNLVETLKNEYQLSPSQTMKLSRRMVIALDKIITRYLTKGEIQRMDHFLKLMERSWEYLQNWHDLLCSTFARTNPKFSHLYNVLDEVSASFREDPSSPSPRFFRAKTAKVGNQSFSVNQNNLSVLSTEHSRETRPSVLNKLRSVTISLLKDKKAAYLEDTLQIAEQEQEQDQKPMNATVSATMTVTEGPVVGFHDVNIMFHLDEFMKYFLSTLLNWANFYKKSRKFNMTYRILLIAISIVKSIDKSANLGLLRIISQTKIALGVFYYEFGKHKDSVELLESALTNTQVELSMHIEAKREESEEANEYASMEKIKTTVRHLILILINLGAVYEQRDQFAKCMESFKLGLWFAKKYLASDDELIQVVGTQYHLAHVKYDRYLKEVGELERISGVNDKLPFGSEQRVNSTNEHFEKMNIHLYNKFNYEKLNASQIIVAGPKEKDNLDHNTSYNNKTEPGETELSEKDAPSKAMNASTLKLPTHDGHDSPKTTASFKAHSMNVTMNTINLRRKKEKKKYNSLLHDEEEPKRLTSAIYRKKDFGMTQEEIEQDLDSDEEREHIIKLNRNIKDRLNKRRKNVKSKLEGLLSIDTYFEKFVNEKIKEKEESLNVQALDFKHMVKNYANFVKGESFDTREFSFAKKALEAKSRENLGDYSNDGKFFTPGHKALEINNFKIETSHLEAKYAQETSVQNRTSVKPGNRSMTVKTVKFADTPEQPAVDESTTANQNTAKANLAKLLFKHKTDLQLKAVESTVREMGRAERTQSRKKVGLTSFSGAATPLYGTASMLRSPLSTKSNFDNIVMNRQERSVDAGNMQKMSQMSKNIIELLMENAESKIGEDIVMRKRIEDNKPLIPVKKVSDKFLKISDELAKSTMNLSMKIDSHTKKKLTFTQVVKGAQLVPKKVVIKEPSRSNL